MPEGYYNIHGSDEESTIDIGFTGFRQGGLESLLHGLSAEVSIYHRRRIAPRIRTVYLTASCASLWTSHEEMSEASCHVT